MTSSRTLSCQTTRLWWHRQARQTVHSLLIDISIEYQLPLSFILVFDRFGSKYRSNVTGIIYNDQMDNFDTQGHNIVDCISPSSFNFPAQNKRPFSSISPAIPTNDSGRVQLVIGASGGKRITTAVSLVGLRTSFYRTRETEGYESSFAIQDSFPR